MAERLRRLLSAYKLRFVAKQSSTSDARPIIVEFSSPNVCKPFHVGHLRSTFIGRTLSNLLCASSRRQPVVRLNWLGDWGTQFGLLAAAFQQYGNAERLNEVYGKVIKGTADDKEIDDVVDHLVDLYIGANAMAKESGSMAAHARHLQSALEQRNDTISDGAYMQQFWRQSVTVSRAQLERVYKQLGVEFTEQHSESMYAEKGQKLVNDWLEKGLVRQLNDGAVTLTLHQKQKDGTQKDQEVILRKSDGSTIYLTRDLCTAIERVERWQPSEILYVVDISQHTHFDLMKRVLEAIGRKDIANLIRHVPFGRVRGMSTRQGEQVLVSSWLSQLTERCRKMVIDDLAKSGLETEVDQQHAAEQMTLAALCYRDLKKAPKASYTFNWDEALRTRGETGIYLQLVHARLCSILRHAWREASTRGYAERNYDVEDLLMNEEKLKQWSDWYDEMGIIERAPKYHMCLRMLLDYDNMLEKACKEYEPYHFCKLVYFMTNAIGKLMTSGDEKLISLCDCEKELMPRLMFYHIARAYIADGIRIIGAQPLQRC